MSKPKKSEIALHLASATSDDLDELTERVMALEEAVFDAVEEEADLDYCEQCNDCHYYDLDDDSDVIVDWKDPSPRVLPDEWADMLDRMFTKTIEAFEGDVVEAAKAPLAFADEMFDIFEDDEDVDPVNHPSHYADDPSGVECIYITQHMNFNLGNAFKYLFRAGRKGNMLEDLRKALWYVHRQIELLETGEGILAPLSVMKRNPAVIGYMNYRHDVSEVMREREEDARVAMQYNSISNAMAKIAAIFTHHLNPHITLEMVANSIVQAINAQNELEAK